MAEIAQTTLKTETNRPPTHSTTPQACDFVAPCEHHPLSQQINLPCSPSPVLTHFDHTV